MKHDFNIKERGTENIPPEKLYEILHDIFPKKSPTRSMKILLGLNQ